jgi:HSP20 family protein
MNVIRWEPLREMEDLFRQYALAPVTGLVRGAGEATPWKPAADIAETDKEYLVRAELPGVGKENVKIDVQDDVLTISGERKLENEQADENRIRVERFYGSFSRSFALPQNVDTSNIRAESKDGVVLVHIPKKSASKPEPVSIEVK